MQCRVNQPPEGDRNFSGISLIIDSKKVGDIINARIYY